MAEAVVDRLEPIEVEIQHGKTAAAMLLFQLFEAFPETTDEDCAVVDAGQRIEEFTAAGPCVHHGPRRCVGQRPGKSHRATRTSATHRDAAAQKWLVSAVFET